MGIGYTDSNGNSINPDNMPMSDNDRMFINVITSIGNYVSQVAVYNDYNPGYSVSNLNDIIKDYYNDSKDASNKLNDLFDLIKNEIAPNSPEAYQACDKAGIFQEPNNEVKAYLDKQENDSLSAFLDKMIIQAPDEIKPVAKLVIGTALKLSHNSDPINRSTGKIFENDNVITSRFIADNIQTLNEMLSRGVQYADKQIVDLMFTWLAENHDLIDFNDK